MTKISESIPLSLDTLLLLLLLLPHLWFNPVSNALLVLGMVVYVALDMAFPRAEEVGGVVARWLYLARLTIVLLAVVMAVALPAGLNIMQRLQEGPATHAHDGLIQTEEAVKFLLAGKNPYTEDYVNTPMADFPGREPPLTTAPLYHNAYLPFLFILSLPFYKLSQAAWGWYDQRFVYLLAFFLILLLLPQFARQPRRKLALLTAFGLNFLFDFYLADGRNDVVVLAGLVLTTFLLLRGRITISAIILGFTLMVKHSAWFFLPFYFWYLLPDGLSWRGLRNLLRQTWPMAAVVAAILLPFLLWDARAFVDDTVLYITGSGPDSFPIKGWGFSTLLLALGMIPVAESAFPFGLFELLLGLPVLFWLLRRQRGANELSNVWMGYALFSFTVQYFSRFFSDNYFIFILQALIIALFMNEQAQGGD
ncbi:MAG: hypothetical protein H6650_19000 [Ardenticatenales bacterium]|nr:hypothetical protein [Ardenticatenales bacterium]